MKKYLLFLLVPILLVLAQTAVAQTVYRYDGDVTTVRGDAVAGATITVYDANTTNKPTLYAGNTVLLGTKSNPTYTDGYGRYFFYLPAGTYDVTISGYNITEYTLEDVNLGAGEATNTGRLNVVDFGAVGDGVTDDTAFIQAAIDSAEVLGNMEIFFPPLTYRTTSTLVVENMNVGAGRLHVNLGQAEVVADTSIGGPIIQLGNDGTQDSYDDAQHANIDLTGGLLRPALRNWNNTVGLRLVNLVTSHIRDVEIRRCEKGIELSAITSYDGTSYNSISFRHIGDCLYAVYIESDYGGWANENYFYGDGRVSYSTSLVDVDCSGGAGFYARSADPGGTSVYGMNMITVSGISLEFSPGDDYWEVNGHKAPPAIDFAAERSSFAGVRTEGWNYHFDLTGATNVNPCVVALDVTEHGLEVGDYLYFSDMVGMTELDNNSYEITAVSDTGVTLDLDASGFGAAGTDGTASYLRIIKTDNDRNFIVGGVLPGADIREVMSPVERARTCVLGGRTSILSGGSATAPVLELRAASGGYRVLEVSTAAGTTPTFYIQDNGTLTFVPRGAVATPDEGAFYYDSTLNKMSVYTGQEWEALVSYQPTRTGVQNDTTPSVARARVIMLPANTVPTAITQLDYGYAGQILTIIGTSASNSSTIADGGNFKLNGAWTANEDDTLTLFSEDGLSWIEVSRSDN